MKVMTISGESFELDAEGIWQGPEPSIVWLLKEESGRLFESISPADGDPLSFVFTQMVERFNGTVLVNDPPPPGDPNVQY
jgi:hypothetical protein